MIAFFAGFSLGLSLILAIGSQNAFVLKQGLKNNNLFTVCAICAVSDALLIVLGVGGFGAIVNKYPAIEITARYGGALFLLTYSFLSFKSAITENHALVSDVASQTSLKKTVAMCLAFTWLNPHVYLDTVILLGSVSTQYQPSQWIFALGASIGSFVFFFSLGYGARVLAPVFQKPVVWKILEYFIGITMLLIAVSLMIGN